MEGLSMRALTQIGQARQDKAERIYRATATISHVAYRNGPPSANAEVLTCALQVLIAKSPWNDSMMVQEQGVARSILGECGFVWDDNKNVFVSSPSPLPMRRGQILAFENWFKALLVEFNKLKIPNLPVGVSGIITYKVHVNPLL